jgi:hypothetical protein
MLRICTILAACTLLFAACGGTTETFPSDVPTQAPPIVSSVTPTSGKAGDTITINGLGFSSIAPNNTVVIGGVGTSATSYAILNPPTATEIESLTATVPVGAAVGASSVLVIVYENASNADVMFTVNP